MSEKGVPLPKFGEWDENDPASAEGFTVIFAKASDEKKSGTGNAAAIKNKKPSKKEDQYSPGTKKRFCCF